MICSLCGTSHDSTTCPKCYGFGVVTPTASRPEITRDEVAMRVLAGFAASPGEESLEFLVKTAFKWANAFMLEKYRNGQ